MTDGYKHVLHEPISNALKVHLPEDVSSDEIAVEVLLALSAMGVISYSTNVGIKLLTPAGRVLVSLMERPNMTMRELSLYLGTTEANVLKQVTALVKANVIARTKVKGRNTYRLNLETALNIPDITRFYCSITEALTTTK